MLFTRVLPVVPGIVTGSALVLANLNPNLSDKRFQATPIQCEFGSNALDGPYVNCIGMLLKRCLVTLNLHQSAV